MVKNKNFLNFFCKNDQKYPDDLKIFVVNKVGGVKKFSGFYKKFKTSKKEKNECRNNTRLEFTIFR